MAKKQKALAPVASAEDDGSIVLRLMDCDLLTEHATVRVPADDRPFQIGHNGLRYQQSRAESDGSWIYQHLTK